MPLGACYEAECTNLGRSCENYSKTHEDGNDRDHENFNGPARLVAWHAP